MNRKLIATVLAFTSSLSPQVLPLSMPHPNEHYKQVGFASKPEDDFLYIRYTEKRNGTEMTGMLTSSNVMFCSWFSRQGMAMCPDLREVEIYIDAENIRTALMPPEMRYDMLLQFLKHAVSSVSPKYSEEFLPHNIVIHTGAIMHLEEPDSKRMIKIPEPPMRIGISTFDARSFIVNVHKKDGSIKAFTARMAEVLFGGILTQKLIQCINFANGNLDQVSRFTVKIDGKIIHLHAQDVLFLGGNTLDIYL